MKIRYLPSSPKSGQEEHVRNDVGSTLIAAGFAVAVPAPRRGTNEYLQMRAEQSALVTKADPHDTVPSAPEGVEWGVKQMLKGKAIIVRKVNGEVQYLDGPTPDCPATIRQAFNDACLQNPEANKAALEEAKRLQHLQDSSDRAKGKTQVLVAQALGR